MQGTSSFEIFKKLCSEEENVFIRRLTGNEYLAWIGANDLGKMLKHIQPIL